MIAASLIAIALISGLVYYYQAKGHEEKIRLNGVALTRALASADYAQVVPESGNNSLLSRLISAQASDDFAYGLVVDPAGRELYATTQASRIAPPAGMPTAPFDWYGEHLVTSLSGGRTIREFFAPVMKAGDLAGFVRLGYYDRSSTFLSNEISSLALMALPVFLLTVLSYFVIRRELKPLERMGAQVEAAARSFGARTDAEAQPHANADFMQRFDQFMQLIQERVQLRESQAIALQTNTRLLSYRQEKAEAALNAMPEGLVVIDDACLATYANTKAETLLSHSATAIVGRPPEEWCNEKTVLDFILRFRNAPAGTVLTSIEYQPEGSSGRRVSVAAYPLFSPRDKDNLFGRLIILRDVSSEYLARQAGAEFVSHVSHELKTPLNTLATYSELLQDFARLKEAERVDAVNVIHGEVERMTVLINNLLNISKLETGTLQLTRTRVKLHELLRDAFDDINSHALGTGINLQMNIPPDLGSVRLDKAMFRIAIDNLLSNAVKYSNAPGRVVLSAWLLDDHQIQISVKDQGIGMTSEDAAHVFEKYYRANSTESANRSGHGLGLYLARQIIEQHHGTITVKSELGKGTEFLITFKAQSVNLEEIQAT